MTGLALVEEDAMDDATKVGTTPGAGTPDEMHERPLKGWKSIAAELGVSESWAETTGRANGLPVRQVGRAVFAYPSELHAWLRAALPGPSNQTESTPRAPSLRVVSG